MKINTDPNGFAHFAERSAEIEELRRLPQDVVDRLIDAGVFRMWIPQQHNGAELSLLEGLTTIENIAYQDGSTGWCAMIGATTALVAAFLPERFAAQIYGRNPRVVTGGFAMPAGRATRVDGGLRVSGHWSWGSGIQHCQWIGGGCFIVEEKCPVFALFEAEQINILDTWYTMGLRGTGSTDYETEDAFVPEGRWVALGVDLPRVPGALYRFPFWGALAMGVTSVSLGLARRAIDELKQSALTKKPAGSNRVLAERPIVQTQIAEAEAAVLSSQALLHQTVNDAWQTAETGRELTVEQRRLLRLAATNATLQSAHAVDLMYHAAGGSAVFTDSALQRVFRDVHVATQHAMVSPRIYELVGRLSLGLETDTTLL
ncbi:MAG TPA: acyl-CoA dehydrogenase family protein [Blastocatellia bacterium]|nr:acyl-CoA dehydrogenase family protein [Blastocatellia bacterium]